MPTTTASLSEELLNLKEDTGWSWNEMANQVEYALEMRGPSGSSLFRYAKGQAHPSGMVEQTVLTAIQRIREQQLAEAEESAIELEVDEDELHESTREISEIADQIAVDDLEDADEIDELAEVDDEVAAAVDEAEEVVVDEEIYEESTTRVAGISAVYAIAEGWSPATLYEDLEPVADEAIHEEIDELAEELEAGEAEVAEDEELIEELEEVDELVIASEVTEVDETAEILEYTHAPVEEESVVELRSLDWAVASLDLDESAQAVTVWSEVAAHYVAPRVILVGIATEAQAVTAWSMVGQHVIENTAVYEPRVSPVGVSPEAQAVTAWSAVGLHAIENRVEPKVIPAGISEEAQAITGWSSVAQHALEHQVAFEPPIISMGVPVEAQMTTVWTLVAENAVAEEVVNKVVIEEPAFVEGPEVDAICDEVAAIADSYTEFTIYEPEQLFDLADFDNVVAPGVFMDAVSEVEETATSEVPGTEVEELGSAEVVEEAPSIEVHLSLYADRNGFGELDPDVVVKAPIYTCRSRGIIFSPVEESES